MLQPRDQSIQTLPLPNGVRYVLPMRDLSDHRTAGWVLTGTGVIATLFMLAWMAAPAWWGVQIIQEGSLFGLALIAFALLGLGGLRYALMLLAGGLTILQNRSQAIVELRRGKLYAGEQLLMLRWVRKRRVDRIEQLTIRGDAIKNANIHSQAAQSSFQKVPALVAAGANMKEIIFAPAYPRSLLLELAKQIADRLNIEAPALTPIESANEKSSSFNQPKRVAVIDQPDLTQTAAPVQPANSNIIVDRRADGLTLTLPPQGFKKGSKGLFGFAVIWNVFISIFIVVIIVQLVRGQPLKSEDGDLISAWWGLLFMVPFIAVGVGVMLAAMNMAKRRAVIDVIGQTLLLTRQSIFRTKQEEWRADRIICVETGASGTEVNDRPIMELQIRLKGGKHVGCLSQLDNDELDWLAAEINLALQLSPTDQDIIEPIRDHTGAAVQPPDSRIVIEPGLHGDTFVVPPTGFRKFSGFFLGGAVFTSIGVAVPFFVIRSELANGIDGFDLFLVFFISIWGLFFGGAGALLLISSFLNAQRRYRIEIAGNQLIIDRRSPLGNKRMNWRRDQLQIVQAANSTTKINNRSLKQLRIRLHAAKPVKLMTGRSAAELAWLADKLNRLLDLEAPSDAANGKI